jgi:DNA-binding Xre family transcriptional regulator
MENRKTRNIMILIILLKRKIPTFDLKLSTLMESIGKKIRICRLQKDVTAKQMMSVLGLQKSAYSNLELGKTDITLTTLSKIVVYLNIKYEDVLPSNPKDFFPPPLN